MSEVKPKPSPEDVLRRMLQTPPHPHVQSAKERIARSRKLHEQAKKTSHRAVKLAEKSKK